MSIISLQTVRLGATANDKHDAIRQAGDLLVGAGCVAPAYVQGMLAREQTMSTYIGNGVANLAEVIEDEDAAAQLAQTTDAEQIVERLGRAREAEV
jgi:mannitol/fructose-specific phosphotransferase system IIA component